LKRIPSLDGLRAVSILFVLYGHAVGTSGFPISRLHLGLAEAGVRIFFIISGFLITKLLLQELEESGTVSLSGFYRRRILRIFPAFYVYALVASALLLLGLLAFPLRHLLYAATYTINYVPNRPWHLGHLWSLAVEEQFYLLWPFTLVFLGRRRALQAAAIALLLAPLVRVAQFYLVPSHRAGICEEFHTILDCIATGCLLAGTRDWLWTRNAYRHFLTSWQFWLAPAAMVAAVMLGVHPMIKWTIGIPIFNLGAAACIDRWTRLPQTDPFARMLNWTPVAFVGVLSYSLYLWQQPFLNRSAHHLWNRFPVNIALAFLAALLSYYLVEKPFLALRHKPPKPKPIMLDPAMQAKVAFAESEAEP
jgi:peptidoglycan/LPS O-acetylase OafA/YrhL